MKQKKEGWWWFVVLSHFDLFFSLFLFSFCIFLFSLSICIQGVCSSSSSNNLKTVYFVTRTKSDTFQGWREQWDLWAFSHLNSVLWISLSLYFLGRVVVLFFIFSYVSSEKGKSLMDIFFSNFGFIYIIKRYKWWYIFFLYTFFNAITRNW